MKRTLIFLALAAASALPATALDFPQSGFQIGALEAPKGNVPTSPLVMCLPASDGFAPNVNVTMQPFVGTMEDYITLSKQEFDQVKWTVVAENKDGDRMWKVEYTDPNPSNPLHFYAKAVSTGKYVYLVTATAKEAQWKTVGEKLKACG